MSDPTYTPPAVWQPTESGGAFSGINRPTAGARHEAELPVGEHPFQLYSLGTPNGVKVTIMFEELLEAGFAGAEYDAWKINIGAGDQFGSGFTALNPNGKIPALQDRSGETPFRVFEGGAILIHLAEKFDYLLPKTNPARAETLSWLSWQIGTAPFIGGGFGHFYEYAPEKYEYAINRYSMETKRIFDVANNQLAETRFLAGDEMTIADVAAYPWLGNLYHGAYSGSDKFLSLHENEHVGRWVKEIDARPAVIRGRLVNTKAMPERHSAADFDAVEDRSLFDPVRKRADV
ncbi:glutathione-dependent disulfide-bond oxidoreductase [Aurantiacibacter gilvus]|uniref:Glutathione-dependent disulfide-bond oxidoreductase n=1 Tax=Aurantiacibacter gilvus TaxID=3139141 RepID=A0ABU9IEC0_9SPHN